MSESKKRVIVVPRWAGNPEKDWYPNLKIKFPNLDILVLDPPNMSAPKIEECNDYLEKQIGSLDLSSTVLIGHSVGNQMIMRYFASRSSPVSVAAFLAVAGWFEVDQTWPTLVPWLDPFDYAKSHQSLKNVTVLVSDNDQFTSNYEKNLTLWKERFSARGVLAPGKKHFNEAEEPDVFKLIEELTK